MHSERLPKGLEVLEIGGRAETIETTTLFRSVRIVEESSRPEETCSDSDTSGKPSVNADGQNSHGIIIMMI